MREHSDPHEPSPHHPQITPRGLLVVAGLLATVPLALYAVEHPSAAATSLLLVGAAATAVSRE